MSSSLYTHRVPSTHPRRGDTAPVADGRFDVKDGTGARFYTRFCHGRWMRG